MTGQRGVYDYPLRAYVAVAGRTDEVEIGFSGWDDVADWMASPGLPRLGQVKAITIIWADADDTEGEARQ